MFYEPLDQYDIVVVVSTVILDIPFVKSVVGLSFSLFSIFYLSISDYFLTLLNFFGASYWNISLFRTLFLFFIFYYLVYSIDDGYVWPRYWQIFMEQLYRFLAGIFKDQVGYRGQIYFPFLATIFLYVLCLNLVGMIPYEGAVTSHLIFNLSLSFTVLFVLTIIGFLRQKKNFLKLLMPPKGVPTALVPLIIFIECVSYVARGISLGVRLFANIMAGHTLLFIFSSFILKVNFFLGMSIFGVIFLVTFLEFFIGSLQAYVFYVLVVMYFRDSIEVSH